MISSASSNLAEQNLLMDCSDIRAAVYRTVANMGQEEDYDTMV